MKVSYDPVKRERVLAERGLDLASAGIVFAGFHLSRADPDHSTNDEERLISVGMLDGEVVIVVWTKRGGERRIITMWKANAKERTTYHDYRKRHG